MVTVIEDCKQVADAIIPREVTQWLPNLPRPCIWLQPVRYEHAVLRHVVKIIVKTKIPPTSPNEAVPPPENYDWRYKQILTAISSSKRTSSVLQKSLLQHFSVFWELHSAPLLSFVLFHRFCFMWVCNLVSYGEGGSRIACWAKYLFSGETIWEETEGDGITKSCIICTPRQTSAHLAKYW
jgi:hypothetical protein